MIPEPEKVEIKQRHQTIKIEKLEAIRGFVAIYIVFHHIVTFNKLEDRYVVLKLIFMHPQEAVLLFFLLSGFVIYLSVANNKTLTFYQYIKKRFVRIFPITIVAFFISSVIFLINGYHFTFQDVKTFAGNVFMLQDLEVPGYIVPVYLKNYPLWSLSYEWWFYVMFFPLFIYLIKRQAKTTIPDVYIILGISAIGWFMYLLVPNHFFLVITYFLLWWTGVSCAEIYVTTRDFTFKSLMPVLISLFSMTLFISFPILNGYFLKHQSYEQINAIYPFTGFLHYYLDALFFLIVGLVWWRYRLKGFDAVFKAFKPLASISFALYIVHFPFLWLDIPFIHNFCLLYATKLTLIIATSYFLEIKMQPLANRLFRNKIKPRKRELESQAF